MIIQELDLKHFGQFSDKHLKAGPGINLITGKNESGKSTAAQFIKVMLYGMKRGRGRASGKDIFSHYTPWDGALPEGSMVFSCQGRTFRLNRRFPEGAELFCVDDGEVLNVAEGDLAVLLGGLSEGLYQNTLYAGSGELYPGTELSEGLGSYLLNLESVQEEKADVNAALKYLKERRKEAEAEYQLQYRLRQEQIAQLQGQLESLEQRKQQIRDRMRLLDDKENTVYDEENLTERGKQLSLEFAAAAFLGILSIVFVSMDHILPAAVTIAASLCFMMAGFIKNRKGADREEYTHRMKREKREIELRLRREHLEEEYEETAREAQRCEKKLKEQWMPGERELSCQQESQACVEAAHRIQEASRILSSSWGKKLEEEASSILYALTGGRYAGLTIGEGTEITVTNGERVLRPDQLSFGTREQIWMSVRLAAALFLSEEEVPFVFDDAFHGWDEQRLEQLLLWLSSCGRQVFLFTGQEREEMLLIKNNLPYSKIVLD